MRISLGIICFGSLAVEDLKADFSGPYLSWASDSITGGFTDFFISPGVLEYSYDVNLGNPGPGVSLRKTTTETTVVIGGIITFDYVYSGFHAFSSPNASFEVLVNGSVVSTEVDSSTFSNFSFSGSVTVPVSSGDTLGLRIGGSNFDSNSRIEGTLQLSNFQAPINVLVTTLDDEDDGSTNPNIGNGVSLREAVENAPNGSIITFDPALNFKTIQLTEGGMIVGEGRELTIDGSGLPCGITIDAGGESQIFEVNEGALTLLCLNLTGGNGDGPGSDPAFGGAIENIGGTLLLERCTLYDNMANFGGAIYSDTAFTGTTTTLRGCTLSENSAVFDGGGIYNLEGAMMIDECTISANTAGRDGAGISVFGDETNNTEVRHTVVAGNNGTDLDDVGGLNNFFSLDYNLIGDGNATSAFHAAGDQIGETNPLLSPLGYYGGCTMTLHPLDESPLLDAGTTTDNGGTDQRGLPRYVNHLSPAQDIGAVEAGRLSRVTSAQDGEPNLGLTLREAIERAEPGQVINFNSGILLSSITLVEEGPTINKPIFIDASFGSERMLISGDDAFRHFRVAEGVGVGMINLHLTEGFARQDDSFADPMDGGAIYNQGKLTLVDCEISHSRTGRGVDERGQAGTPRVGFGGGICNDGGFLQLIASIVRDCKTADRTFDSFLAGHGGGIYSISGILDVDDSKLLRSMTGGGVQFEEQNGGQGGALYARNTGVSLDSTIFQDNRTGDGNTGGHGGGLFISNSELSMMNCEVMYNIAGNGSPSSGLSGGDGAVGIPGEGGGIYLIDSEATVRGSTISGNTTGRKEPSGLGGDNGPSGDGGGIIQFRGTLRLEDSRITGNITADGTSGQETGGGGRGGGIYCDGGSLDLVRCTVAGNRTGQGGGSFGPGSGGDGGGIYFRGSQSFSILGSTISNNRTGNGGGEPGPDGSGGDGGQGGGIYTTGIFQITSSTIANNQTGEGASSANPGERGNGGGIYWRGTSGLVEESSLNHTTISGNQAREGGGVMVNATAGTKTLRINNSVIAQNQAAEVAHRDIRVISATEGFVDYENSTFVGSPPADSNISGTPAGSGDAILMQLFNYGGSTPTMPPAPGSPLIDAATSSTEITDQRGSARNGSPDLGATESFQQFDDFVDTDNDNMDDRLEPIYGFVVGVQDGAEDDDGDGSTNAAELDNLTSPRDNTSLLKIIDFSRGSSSVFLSWTTVPGLEYEIIFGDSLSNFPGSVDVSGPASSSTQSSTLLLPASIEKQFFRVRRR